MVDIKPVTAVNSRGKVTTERKKERKNERKKERTKERKKEEITAA